jgi:hypothetical protein
MNGGECEQAPIDFQSAQGTAPGVWKKIRLKVKDAA